MAKLRWKSKKTSEQTETPATEKKAGRSDKKNKYAFAAPVGFLVSILSIVGVIALVMSLVGFIRAKLDKTELKQELYYYLEPLVIYSPEPFSNAAKSEQDAFLSAACYRVMIAEQNRLKHEGDDSSQYDVEQNLNCYFVPEDIVEDAYHDLFGPKAKLTHRSVEGSGIEYIKSDKCYLIPIAELDTGYEIVIDKVVTRRDRYEVRVGFVPKTDIKYDKHGEPIKPTADQATYFQNYTLTRNRDKGTYYIKSCKDEKK